MCGYEAVADSCLDAYWEEITFTDLEDPEYRPGKSGKIEWAIPKYNGTKESPNKELLMKSDIVRIGGHDWQIKFYPRGNDSDYLSVYVECMSIAAEGSKKKDRADAEAKESENSTKSTSEIPPPAAEPVGFQHTPLPLMNLEQVPKRQSVAAQVCVVLYNPDEPRVNYNRTCLHRFCPYSPDWGWTRFHGPHFQIGHRHRGQRQALLRNDKLAFRAYIRVMDDDTGCLWEHPTRDNPWDSFSMTGLQSLVSGPQTSKAYVPAISSWMLLRPFRTLLYQINTPDLANAERMKPKPMIGALQKILYSLRTLPPTSTNDNGWRQPVSLEDIMDAFSWYGIENLLNKVDVVEAWEVIRTKLEEELYGTPLYDQLEALFGRAKDRTTGLPTYKVSLEGVSNMQEAIDDSADIVAPNRTPPVLLQVELERQKFDMSSRSWKRVVQKIKLVDHIVLKDCGYTLYGIITQTDGLQSGLFNAVLRPNGPGGNWYQFSDKKDFSDGKEEQLVVCLSKKQAVDQFEGFASPKPQEVKESSVAYIVLYIRDDVSEEAFFANSEPAWEPPKWVVEEVNEDRGMGSPRDIPEGHYDPEQPSIAPTTTEANPEVTDSTIDLQIFNSKVFLAHEGPGFVNLYDKLPSGENMVQSITVNSKADWMAVRDKIASVTAVRDPRQVKFWVMDPSISYLKPDIRSAVPYPPDSRLNVLPSAVEDWSAEGRLWYHILDEASLPSLNTPSEKANDLAGQITATTNLQPIGWASTSQPPPPANLGEDTLMSEAEDDLPITILAVPQNNAIDRLAAIMGTDELNGNLSAAPPPPPGMNANPLVPAPPGPARGEIYFFLKRFEPATQKLVPIGSYIVKRGSRVDHTVHKILNVPKEASIAMYEEQTIAFASPLRRRKTFDDLSLPNGSIIIVQQGAPSDTSELSARAAFPDPATYLANLAEDRKFPHRREGVFALDYFGSEHYRGQVRAHMPHGEGTKIYFNGDAYTGAFQLGKRHGKGQMVYANGDSYIGSWERDQTHGDGVYTEAATKNTYSGGWKEGKRHGEGVTHWKLAQEAERLCRICWEESAEAAFYDCGHVVACMNCARRVDQCPVCRKRVLSALKLYYVT